MHPLAFNESFSSKECDLQCQINKTLMRHLRVDKWERQQDMKYRKNKFILWAEIRWMFWTYCKTLKIFAMAMSWIWAAFADTAIKCVRAFLKLPLTHFWGASKVPAKVHLKAPLLYLQKHQNWKLYQTLTKPKANLSPYFDMPTGRGSINGILCSKTKKFIDLIV